MRKFPDQGCSKLLWGRGVVTEGELPPSPPVHTYGVLRIGFSRGFVYFNRNVIKIVVTQPFCAFAAE